MWTLEVAFWVWVAYVYHFYSINLTWAALPPLLNIRDFAKISSAPNVTPQPLSAPHQDSPCRVTSLHLTALHRLSIILWVIPQRVWGKNWRIVPPLHHCTQSAVVSKIWWRRQNQYTPGRMRKTGRCPTNHQSPQLPRIFPYRLRS